jgi:hypothetical protein
MLFFAFGEALPDNTPGMDIFDADDHALIRGRAATPNVDAVRSPGVPAVPAVRKVVRHHAGRLVRQRRAGALRRRLDRLCPSLARSESLDAEVPATLRFS